MITELQTIKALTTVADEPGEVEQPIDYERRCAQLEAQLRGANHTARVLLKRLKNQDSSPEHVQHLVNVLNVALSELRLPEAKAYLLTAFSPDRLAEIEQDSPVMASALRAAIRSYCKNNNLPLMYAAWGQD